MKRMAKNASPAISECTMQGSLLGGSLQSDEGKPQEKDMSEFGPIEGSASFDIIAALQARYCVLDCSFTGAADACDYL